MTTLPKLSTPGTWNTFNADGANLHVDGSPPVIRCSTITLLAHSMPGAGVVHYIICVISAIMACPVHPSADIRPMARSMVSWIGWRGMSLYLRKVIHPEAHDNYRVVLKLNEGEFEIGSIGIEHDAAWRWGIDTVIPIRVLETQGKGKNRRDCMRQFKVAWERFAEDEAHLVEFLNAKRKRR